MGSSTLPVGARRGPPAPDHGQLCGPTARKWLRGGAEPLPVGRAATIYGIQTAGRSGLRVEGESSQARTTGSEHVLKAMFDQVGGYGLAYDYNDHPSCQSQHPQRNLGRLRPQAAAVARRLCALVGLRNP